MDVFALDRSKAAFASKSFLSPEESIGTQSTDLGEMAPKLAFALPILLLGWAIQAILRPPPTKLCGSPGGPPLTSPRIKLRDGRYLAYREDGVQRDEAKYKIITAHAFDSTKDIPMLVSKVIKHAAELEVK
jgi:hypothetical protein